MTDAPPSTRSVAIGVPRRRAIASTTSRVWYAIASTTARAMWAVSCPARDADDRAAGVRVPPRAAEAGERRHDVRRRRCRSRDSASGPISAAVVDHAEPVAQPLDGGAGDEDRALERVGDACRRPSCHATVVSMPSVGGGHSAPTFISTKLPVPYVFFAMPGVEACLPEQRRLLVAGDAADRDPAPAPPHASTVVPNRPLDGRTSGRASTGTRSSRHSSSLHARCRMSNSIVRLALVTDRWRAPRRR